MFLTISSPLSVNLYNLPFLASGLMHSTSSFTLKIIMLMNYMEYLNQCVMKTILS